MNPEQDSLIKENRFLKTKSAWKSWQELRKNHPILLGLITFCVALGLVIGITLTVRTYAVQAFYIKSTSMEPTLKASDRIFVNKLSYSLHQINRGDVIIIDRSKAFQEKNDPNIDDLVKRVIGLEGERVEIRSCKVYINGVLLEEPYISERSAGGPAAQLNCLDNVLGNGIFEVPEDHVFVLGDNRPNSIDSRVFGSVPESSVIGRAFVKIWPLWDIQVL